MNSSNLFGPNAWFRPPQNIGRGFLSGALLIGLAIGSCGTSARAAVEMPAIYSDHMVLQQDAENPIWGWDEPGQAISITLASGDSQNAKAKSRRVAAEANAQGRWQAKLPALTAGGPWRLTIAGSTTVTIGDVLVGEVWFASGQSNMAMTVSRSLRADQEQAAAEHPQIRMFTTSRIVGVEPSDRCSGTWQVCSPETVGGFSATAYFFGRKVHQELKRPVGLINSSWGGTAVEAWTSRQAQEKYQSLKPVLAPWDEKVNAFDESAAKQQFDKALARWKEASARAKAAGKRVPRRPQLANPTKDQNRPANLYNGMVHPHIPYGIRGAIWYQGERNRRSNPELYGEQLKCLIRDWRDRWELGDFPFILVQLPNFQAAQSKPIEPDGWVTVRDGMDSVLKLDNTGMAVTTDIGEANDIHPRNKQDVGKRLALWALANTYKQDVVFSGPRFTSAEFSGNQVVLTFEHVADGLQVKGEKLEGFAMAGEDKVFHWAQAEVRGDRVHVTCPEVAMARSVRYAWAPNPQANLFNSEGLPAAPLRTDNWSLK